MRMPPCKSTGVLADFARQVEQAGFDTLCVPDSQTMWRDAYLTSYAAAPNTSALHVTTAVRTW